MAFVVVISIHFREYDQAGGVFSLQLTMSDLRSVVRAGNRTAGPLVMR
jgi:hypothetical protein